MTTETLRVVGASPARLDAREKVTGRTRYTTDLAMRGMVHAQIWRSPLPHAGPAGANAQKVMVSSQKAAPHSVKLSSLSSRLSGNPAQKGPTGENVRYPARGSNTLVGMTLESHRGSPTSAGTGNVLPDFGLE